MNKAKSGYCLLMILSAVDNEFQAEEKEIINKYVENNWPEHFENDACDKMISELTAEEWWPKFVECRDYFYSDTTEAERNEFLQFAMDLVKADDVITSEENRYLKSLFDTWDPNNE